MKSSILSGLVLVVAPSFVAEQTAFANPLGGVVAAGSATISQSGGALTVNQTSSRAVIDWNSFNISSGQSASFHFLGAAGANSAVLNEVSGAAGQSFLNGLLNSYVGSGNHVGGTIYIYNPNGLLIGPQGFINVGSFIGTSLAPSDSSFMKGSALTLGSSTITGGSTIENDGQISALDGDIFLIAHNVVNSGSLTAHNVGLAAGSYVEIKQPGEPGAAHLSILASGSSIASGTGAANAAIAPAGGTGVNNTATGLIKAVTTQLQASGGNVYALAVNNAGVIHADTVVNQGGSIYLTGNGGLVQNSGTLDVSDTAAGGKGGKVEVTGSQVTLTGTSAINANGDTGGGTVLIGGGSRGQNPAVANATDTTVDAGATITANAITSGNGGKVVVFSDDATIFNGQISALGGAKSGLGGSAEVSGDDLSISGHADLLAPNGKAGTLLLDPGSVTIQNGPNTGPSSAMNVFNDGWINNQLDTSALTIDTANSTDGLAQNLTVLANAAISWNSPNNLILNGANSVIVNGTITGTGTGGLTLSSSMGNIAIQDGSSISIGGGVSMSALSGISITGPLTLTGSQGLILNANSGGTGLGIFTLGAAISSGGNPLTISAGGINFNAIGTLNSGAATTTINATDGASIGLGSYVAGGLNIADANLGRITAGELSLNTTGTGTVTVGGITQVNSANVGTVSINSSAVTLLTPSVFNGGLDLTTSGNIQIEANLTTGSGQTYDGPVSLYGGGTLTLAGAGIDFVSTIVAPNGASLVVADSGATTFGGTVGAGAGQALGSLTTMGTSVTVEGNISTIFGQTYNDGVRLYGGGPLTLTGTGIDFVSTIVAPNGASLVVADSGATTFGGAVGAGAGQALGSLTTMGTGVTLDGNVTTIGGQTYYNAVTLNGAGTMTLTGTGIALLNTVTSAANQGLDVVESGTTQIGGSVNTGTGSQTYGGAVSLYGGGVLTLTGTGIDFASTIVAPNGASLNVSDSGATIFGGTVSGGLGSLTTTGTGVTIEGNITTISGQTYHDGVTLYGGGTLTLTGTGIDFASAVVAPNGAGLIVSDSGATTFGGTVGAGGNALRSLTTTGTGVTLDGNITTISGQTYHDAVTLNGAGAVTLTGTGIDLMSTVTSTANQGLDVVEGGTTLLGGSVNTGTGSQTYGGAVSLYGGGTLVLTGMGIDFVSTIVAPNGASLNVSDSGATIFGGTVGGGLGSLTTTGTGVTIEGNITTTFGQTYHDPVDLYGGASFTLTGTGIDFANTVVAPQGASLMVADSGTTTFGAAVGGGGDALGALTTTGTGVTIAGNVTTMGGQTYYDAVTLNGAGSVTLTGSGISLLSTVTSAANQGLDVAESGITLLGGNVNTGAGSQTYGGAVSLYGGGTLTLSGKGIDFVSTIVAPQGAGLNVSDSGATVFGGTVGAGAGDALASLTTSGTGVTLEGNVTTIFGQTYNDGVTLFGGGTLTLTGLGIDFVSMVSAPNGASLMVADGGTTQLGGNVTTGAGTQTYAGPVQLTGNVTVTGSIIDFASSVSGGGYNLTLDNSGMATLNGTVSGVNALTADGIGMLLAYGTISASSLSDYETTTFTAGSVTTTGDQNYHGATLTLTMPTILTSGTLELGTVSAGNNGLTLDNSQLATASGTVTAGTLTLEGAGDVGAQGMGNAVNTVVAGIVLDNEAGNGWLNNGSLPVNLSGISANGGLDLTAGPITINAALSTETGSLTLNTTTLNLANSVAGGTVTLDNSGLVTGSGIVTANILDLEGAGNLGGIGNAINTDVNNIGFENNSGSVWLNNGGNAVSISGTTVGANVNLSAGATTFGTTDVGGNLILTVGGPVSETGGAALVVAGTTTISSGVNSITLNNIGNDLAGTVTVATTGAGGVSLNNGNHPLTLQGSVGGNLMATAAGIGDGGSSLTVGGTTSLAAGAGNITFEAPGDSFAGPVTIISGNNVALDDALPLSLSGIVSGNLNASANGIDIDGALTVKGDQGATLNADPNNTGLYVLTLGGLLDTSSASGPVSITAANVNFTAGSISSGSGLVLITASHNGTIGLGAAAGNLMLTGLELANISTSGGLTLNTTGGADVLVDGVTTANSMNVTGPLTINAPGGTVSFVTAPSFFNSLVINADPIDLNANVTTATAAGQTYNGVVTVGAPSVILTATGGGGVSFSSTIDSMTGAESLDVEASGVASFGGLIGHGMALNNFTVDGTSAGSSIFLNAVAVKTIGSQSYGAGGAGTPLTLGAPTMLSSTGGGNIDLASTVNGSQSLDVETTGTTTFGGAVGGSAKLTSLTVDATDSGTIDLDGGSITTTAGQTYGGPVTLGANTSLKDAGIGSIIFSPSATISGTGDSLTVGTTGTETVMFGAAVSTKSLTVDATDTTGLIKLAGGTVTTTAGQTYDAAVTLGTSTVLKDTVGGQIVFGASATINGGTTYALDVETTGATAATFSAAIVAKSLTVDATDPAGIINMKAGTVTTTSGQTYDAEMTLLSKTVLTDMGTGNITFGPSASISTGTGAAAYALDVETTGATATTFGAAVTAKSLTVDMTDTSGLIGLKGGTVTTSAGQTYDGAVTLGANTLLTDTGSGPITFGSTASINGGTTHTLEVETSGTASFGGAINVLGLAVDKNDTGGKITLDGATVTTGGTPATSAGQSYGGAITLGVNTVLQDTAGGAITFAKIGGSAESLEVETAGTTTFGNAVTIKSLLVDKSDTGGMIDLNGGTVTTSGGQEYDGAVTLNVGTTLTDNSSSPITFGALAAITGAQSLEVETGGITTFGALVNVSSLFADKKDNAGTIDLNGGVVTTSAGQIYGGAVTLGAGTVLTDTGSSAINFLSSAPINGAQSLEVETKGTTTFGAAVAVKSLLTDKSDTSGTIDLVGGTVSTSAGQTYDGAVTLSAGTVLSDTGNSAISFGPSAGITGAWSLEVESGGTTTFGAPVNVSSLIADQKDTAGTIDLNAGMVATTAGQLYGGAVVLGTPTVLSDTGNSAISFGPLAAITGAQTLDVETGGTTTFGAMVTVKSLTADQMFPSATIDLNGGTVTTSAGQTYDGAVTLGTGTLLSDTGGSAISFGPSATISGAQSLDVETGGVTTFGAAVNVQSVVADQTATGGSIDLNGPSVTTALGQTYDVPVTLGSDVRLTGTTLSLPALNIGTYNLTLINSGLATLNGAVNGTGNLTASGAGSLQVDGAITAGSVSDTEMTTLSGGTVTTPSGDQSYTGAIILGANTTLNSDTIELAGVTGANYNLTLNNTGSAQLNGNVAVGSLSANSTAGSLLISAVTITTGTDQDYAETVNLGTVPVTLSSGTIELETVNIYGESLTLNNSGLATFYGPITGTGTSVLTANGNGTGTLAIDNTINVGTFVDNEVMTTTGLLGGTITTVGGQSYGAVTLNAATTLTASTIVLGPVTGDNFDLTLNNTGLVQLTGNVTDVNHLTANSLTGSLDINAPTIMTATDQKYNEPVSLSASATLSSQTIELSAVTGNGKNLTLNNSGAGQLNGNVTGVGILTVNGTGSLAINTPTVTTATDQNYAEPLTLGASTVTLSSGTIELLGVTGAGNSLTLNNGGVATLNGMESGLGTLSASGGGTLVVNYTISGAIVSDSESTTLHGGSVTTTGNQSYNAPVTLTAPTILSSTVGGNIMLASTVTGTETLDVETTGATTATFRGAVNVNGLTVDAGNSAGLIDLNGGTVTTTGGDQNYAAAITLSSPTTLKSDTIELAAVNGNGNNLTLNNSGLLQLNGNVTGVGSLTAVNGTGSVAINAGSVTTVLDQNYGEPVTLGAPTVALTSGTIELAAVTGAGNNLTLYNSGVATLNGLVSGTGILNASGTGSLTVNNNITGGSLSDTEATAFNGTGSPAAESVTTTGDQNYSKTITLGASTTLNSGSLELSTVVGNNFTLTLNNSGAATLNGNVTGVSVLTANNLGGSLDIDTATITTTSDQNYKEPVSLGAATVTLNSATIELAAVTGNSDNLALNNSGMATLSGTVTGVNVLTANNLGGSLNIETPTITTISDQNYKEPVFLGATTVTLNSETIELAAVTGNGDNLTLNNSGLATLNGTVTGVNMLTANNLGGSLNIDTATITTTSDQNYKEPVSLGTATVTLNSATIELAGVTGNGDNLTLNNSGLATLNGAVTGTGVLTASGAGALTMDNNISSGAVSDGEATTFNGTGSPAAESVTTTGGQSYTSSVTLGANTTLTGTSLSLSTVTLGGDNLTLVNSGAATLNGAVNGTGALTASGAGSLIVDSQIAVGSVSDSEATTLNGTGSPATEVVTTTGSQSYTGALTLGASTVLSSTHGGNITLGSMVDGPQTLEVETTGITMLGGTVGGKAALASLTLDQADTTGTIDLNGGAVTTSAGQLYGGKVNLGADTTLKDIGLDTPSTDVNPYKAITFGSSIDGAQALSVEAGGTITFLGALGAMTPLSSLYVDYTGNHNTTLTSKGLTEAIDLNGGGVTTTGTQRYIGSLDLSEDTFLSSGTTANPSTVALSTVNGNGYDFTLKPGELEGTGANGSGVIYFNNTGSGTVNLVNATENPNITSITYFNPFQATQFGDVLVGEAIDELLDDEGGGIRSAFDLAKKSVGTRITFRATENDTGELDPAGHLLRSSTVYNDLHISPSLHQLQLP